MLIIFLFLSVAAYFVAADFDPVLHENWKLLNNDLCGDSTAPRIIGGEKAQIGEIPWIARIGYATPNDKGIVYGCAGSIINNRTILTAAHCVTQLPPGYHVAAVVLGEQNALTNPDCMNDFCAPPIKIVKPAEIIIHGNYDKMPLPNDIALIRLDQTIEFSGFIRPICMVRGSLMKNDFTGSVVQVAGWGITDVETGKTSPELLKVNIEVTESQPCREAFQKLAPVKDSQLCAGGIIGKDSCGGDSGAPLMLVASEDGPPRVYIIGLVSFGSKRCGSKLPAVYTRITSFTEWILDNLDHSKKDYKVVSNKY